MLFFSMHQKKKKKVVRESFNKNKNEKQIIIMWQIKKYVVFNNYAFDTLFIIKYTKFSQAKI